MIEKPAGVYTAQVKTMNEAADRAGTVFGIMFNQRTHHVYRKMRELVMSGELGAIRRINWIITDWYRPQAYYDSGTWRGTWKGEGGGVLMNQCPHNLDLLYWICGMPRSIHAKMHFGKWHQVEIEDDVSAYLEYENGATGVFVTSTGDVPGSNRFELTLDGGKLLAENGKLSLWKLGQAEPEFSRLNKELFATPDMEKIDCKTDGQFADHAGVLNAFAGAILRNEPLIADGREGLESLAICNAMYLSAWTGQEVTLPLDDEAFHRELLKRV
jgi:predicted dehydrogenase